MNFKLSNCIAFQTPDIAKASQYYQEVLGMKAESASSEEVEFNCSPVRFFLGNSEKTCGLILEFLVQDLNSAKEYLEQNGCEVVEWQGKGKPCFMRDPYGLTFNLYQE